MGAPGQTLSRPRGKSLATPGPIFYDNPVRFPLPLFAAALLAGCAGSPPSTPPLPRATYQKPVVAAYAGASSDPAQPSATARGTRYRTSPVASAAADWSRWPAGTVFRILSTGEIYEVDDYTEDVVGTNTILLFKPATASLPAAPREVTIEIVQWGSPRDSAAILHTQRSSTAKKILTELLERYPERR